MQIPVEPAAHATCKGMGSADTFKAREFSLPEPNMAGGYSCSFGHTWEVPEGHTPTACPVCGDGALIPMGSAISVPPGTVNLKKDDGIDGLDLVEAPVGVATLEYKPEPGWNAPPPKPPSFGSLVPEALPVAQNMSQNTRTGSDVVPFAEAVDYVPPTVPGYEILGEVGRGGMGVVYKARQLSLNRPVALKMILAGNHAGARERERFRREAEAVATLQNPHIVQIFEIGESNGHLYLALEFVEGGNLAQHLKKSPWAAREAAELVEILARAVQYAHHQGVVHRDLKPGNVLLQGPRPEGTAGDFETTKAWDAAKNGDPATKGAADLRSFPVMTHKSLRPEVRPTKLTPKITDFGLAKRLGDTENPDGHTKTGAVMGTPSYIAPEQASGKTKDVGPPVDVYALGAILYELLTGRPPYMGETPLDTVLQVLNDDPVPPKRLQPTVPRDLETICLKCLNKSPAKRYLSADALADDLRRFILGEPIKARPLSAWGRGVKWARRHPSIAILGTFTVVATIALVSVLSVAYAQVSQAVRDKDREANAAKLAKKEEADARHRAELLAEERDIATKKAIEQNEELKRVAERTRRAAFALQLAQIAAMCERDPRRARDLLENEFRCPTDLRDFSWNYLHRLCQREERAYLEHAGESLNTAAFAGNGTFVATAGKNGRVRVWDPHTGKTWAILVGPPGPVSSVAFTPDGGAVAACSSDRAIRLWELPVKMIHEARRYVELGGFLDRVVQPIMLTPDVVLYDAHESAVNCLAFTPDGEYLVSGGDDGYLQYWNLNTWRISNPLLGALGGAGAAGVTLSRAAETSQVVVKEHRSPTFNKNDFKRGVLSLAFAASGKVLVAGCADGRARAMAANGSRTILTSNPAQTEPIKAVAVSPDGRIMAVVNNAQFKSIRLIDVGTGKDVRRLTGHTGAIYGLAMSPDGELLASVGWGGAVRVWDVEDGQERSILQGHEQASTSVAFSPDRRTLVSASFDGSARVWHTTARPNETVDTFRDPLSAVTLSATGSSLFGGDNSGKVQLFRSDVIPVLTQTTAGARPFYFRWLFDAVATWGNPPTAVNIRATATTPNGQLLIAATSEPTIIVWRDHWRGGTMTTPSMISRNAITVKVPLPVYAMTVDPTGQWLATIDAQGIRLWNLRALPYVQTDPKPILPEGPGLIHRLSSPQARDAAFHPTEPILAVAVGDGVRLIDFAGRLVAENLDAHKAPVEVVVFGKKPGQRDREKPILQLATADNTGAIKVWTVDANKIEFQAELPGHTGAVFSLAFTPDGTTLASGGDDRTVNLWDPVSGQERAVLSGHADRILRVQFLPDSSALLTVGRDGSVKRWRAVEMARPLPGNTAPVFTPAPWRPGLGLPLAPRLPGRG